MITPIPRSPAGDILPQKGSSDGIYDGVYATSSMDLRPGYFNKYPRVPLHPIEYSLALATPFIMKWKQYDIPLLCRCLQIKVYWYDKGSSKQADWVIKSWRFQRKSKLIKFLSLIPNKYSKRNFVSNWLSGRSGSLKPAKHNIYRKPSLFVP